MTRSPNLSRIVARIQPYIPTKGGQKEKVGTFLFVSKTGQNCILLARLATNELNWYPVRYTCWSGILQFQY